MPRIVCAQEPLEMSTEQSVPRRWGSEGGLEAEEAARRVRQGNRRRLLVFGLTLAATLLVGQAWNFSRQAEYQTSTRLQVNLPEVGRTGLSASSAYATKLQLFNSRPMLAKLADALYQAGLPSAALGTDPAGQLRSMLQVLPVQGSEVVELRAVGPDPRLLADMLNALPQVLQRDIASRQMNEAEAQLAVARQELARLERTAAERRSKLDAFRERVGVLAERDENEAMARTKGLNSALDVAVEKEAAAAARLSAVAQAVEQGKSSTQVRADPALTALETRAHQTREELKELERGYTPAFTALDPRARALKARLVELEDQITRQRVVSQQAALQSAREEHVSAQAQVERLRTQLGAARPAAAKTAMQFAEAKVLEDDLAQVDKLRRELLERVSRLEADEQRRVATVTVVEVATVPSAPFRPDHWRDAAIVLAAATVLALVVMGTVEIFNRSPLATPSPATTTLVLTPGWSPDQAQLGHRAADPAPLLAAPVGPPSAAALPAPVQILDQPTAAALLAAASGPTRFLCAAGLMGLTVREVLSLRPSDLDCETQRLRVGGQWTRQLPTPPWLPKLLSEEQQGTETVLHDAAGQALGESDVAAIVISAALDAGLDGAAASTWDTLRNTCIDWLVGQGLRYAELPRLVGRVDAELLRALSARHGESIRHDLDEVDFLMPALKLDPAA
jgi:polysaccharide biosynthesis transport protein